MHQTGHAALSYIFSPSYHLPVTVIVTRQEIWVWYMPSVQLTVPRQEKWYVMSQQYKVVSERISVCRCCLQSLLYFVVNLACQVNVHPAKVGEHGEAVWCMEIGEGVCQQQSVKAQVIGSAARLYIGVAVLPLLRAMHCCCLGLIAAVA